MMLTLIITNNTYIFLSAGAANHGKFGGCVGGRGVVGKTEASIELLSSHASGGAAMKNGPVRFMKWPVINEPASTTNITYPISHECRVYNSVKSMSGHLFNPYVSRQFTNIYIRMYMRIHIWLPTCNLWTILTHIYYFLSPKFSNHYSKL